MEELLKREERSFFITQKSIKTLITIRKKLGKKGLSLEELLILLKVAKKNKRRLFLASDKKKLLAGIVDKLEQSLRNQEINKVNTTKAL